MSFMINGRVMDDNRVDQTVKLGDTEEWTVVNTDQQYHSFHIHQTAFLVTEINGVPSERGQSARYVLGAARDRSWAGRVEGGHPLHRSGDRRAFRLSLSRCRPRG